MLKARDGVLSSIFTLCLLLGSSALVGAGATSAFGAGKIQHIIFIIQENKSFDSYFGTYPGANGLSSAPRCCPTSLVAGSPVAAAPFHADVTKPVLIIGDELPPGKMFPDANDTLSLAGGADAVLPFLMPNETAQALNNAWTAARIDWNNGSMNGFIVGEQTNSTMGYYDRTDIPYYWDYASNFVLDDNFFSSMMGGSLPNHLYIASGSSGNGSVSNPQNYEGIVNGSVVGNPPSQGLDEEMPADLSFTWTSMAEELSQQGVSWKWYTGATDPKAANLWDVLPAFSYFQQNPQLVAKDVVGTQNFVNSVKNGSLPSVSWIIPGYGWTPPGYPFTADPQIAHCVTSEHTPARPDCGMDYVSYLIDSVMKSPYWQSTAIVVTWDDFGGFYDHVAPPLQAANGVGFRVPTLIVSPYAKHGYVDHTPYEFGSLLSLLEHGLGLPSLHSRDAVGIGKNDMMNSFDFNQSPQPPLIEPGNFTGPANWPPQSNGYPQHSPESASSTLSPSPLGLPFLSPTQYYYIGVLAVVAVAVLGSALYIMRRHRR